MIVVVIVVVIAVIIVVVIIVIIFIPTIFIVSYALQNPKRRALYTKPITTQLRIRISK